MREVIMKRTITLALSLAMIFSAAIAQTPTTPQKPPQEIAPEDIIRVTTQLVQTDVVVTDKNDKIIKDLKLEDFELYDNGKKQDLQFMEFISVSDDSRSEAFGQCRLPRLCFDGNNSEDARRKRKGEGIPRVLGRTV